MPADFAGETARLYADHRRDLPTDQAAGLAGVLGLRADDVVVDLGCGTGQLGVPLRAHCAGVIAIDPEPAMLAGVRARAVPGVVAVLGADTDLLEVGRLLGPARGVGAVVVGNALHWMDEAATSSAARDLLRPGGAFGVVTQGPPVWLGGTRWQRALLGVLVDRLGPVTDTCGSDEQALADRLALLDGLDLDVEVRSWTAQHPVDADWVVGHLGSALPSGALQLDDPEGLAAAVGSALGRFGEDELVEDVLTRVVVGRRR